MNKKLILALASAFAVLIVLWSTHEPDCLYQGGCGKYGTSGDLAAVGKGGAHAASSCFTLCQQKLNQSQSLTNGPCLSNESSADWVCDVAHNPRQAVDDLPENQCLAYREGKAHHFVEVDENCGLIRAV